MKKLTGLLHEAGDWHRRHHDYTGFSPISIHYRIWLEGHVQRTGPRHKVLCPDQPMYLRRVDMAVARLSKRMRQCIQVKFFSPLKEDGNAFTHRQMALGIGISKDAFEKNVHRGKQKVSRILSKMGVAMS